MKRHLMILTMTLVLGVVMTSVSAQGLEQKNTITKPTSLLPKPCGFSASTPKYDSLLQQGYIHMGPTKKINLSPNQALRLKALIDYDSLAQIKKEMKDLAKLHSTFVKTGTLQKRTMCNQEIPYISIGKGINDNIAEKFWEIRAINEVLPLDRETKMIGESIIYGVENFFTEPIESNLGKPQVLFVGGLHAREANPTQVLVNFYKYLINEYSKIGPDPLVKKVIDNSVIHIIPLVNVDGRRHIELHPLKPPRRKNLKVWWKKYTSDSEAIKSIIAGTQGVDLNRNFPQDWDTNTKGEDSINPTSIFYKGSDAASEAEVQGVKDFIESRVKNGELKLILDMHDGSGPQVTWNDNAQKDFKKFTAKNDQPHIALLAGLESKQTEPDLISELKENGILEKYADEKVKYAIGIELSRNIFFDSRESPDAKKTRAQQHFENLKAPLLTLIKAVCETCQK